MNPIPHGGTLPNTPLVVNTAPELLQLLAIVSMFVIFGMLLWTSLYAATRERVRLVCPTRLGFARVLFRLAPNGTRRDVIHCSLLGRGPFSCGKVCLHPTGRGMTHRRCVP